jgi:Pre ATP-grasp domain
MDEITSILRTLEDTEVTHIFTHHVTALVHRNALETYLPGHEHYDQRALILARPDDIVCVAGNVDQRYVHYLSSLGLGPKGDRIIEIKAESGDDPDRTLASMLLRSAKSLRAMRELTPNSNRVVLHPYLASSAEFDLAAALENVLGKPVLVLGGNADIVARANLKHLAHAKAHELAIPMAPGEIVELHAHSDRSPLDVSPLLRAIARYVSHTGRVIVRGTYGAAGSGTFVAEGSFEDIERKLRTCVEQQVHHIYLVQVMFDIVATPNVQMFVEPGTGAIWCVGATDQRVDKNLSHKGNVFPSNAKTLADMICSAWKLAHCLQTRGFTGLAGFDFVEYVNPETGAYEHIFVEMNARVNGATYPVFLMERLNALQAVRSSPLIEAFLSARTTTKATSFSELQEMYSRLFFDPCTGRGIIPYNTGRLANGMCDLVFLGSSRQDVEDMYQRFSGTHAKPEIP